MCSAPLKKISKIVPNEPGSCFFPTNQDLADILGRTEFHSDDVHFWDFVGFLITRLLDFQVCCFLKVPPHNASSMRFWSSMLQGGQLVNGHFSRNDTSCDPTPDKHYAIRQPRKIGNQTQKFGMFLAHVMKY